MTKSLLELSTRIRSRTTYSLDLQLMICPVSLRVMAAESKVDGLMVKNQESLLHLTSLAGLNLCSQSESNLTASPQEPSNSLQATKSLFKISKKRSYDVVMSPSERNNSNILVD